MLFIVVLVKLTNIYLEQGMHIVFERKHFMTASIVHPATTRYTEKILLSGATKWGCRAPMVTAVIAGHV